MHMKLVVFFTIFGCRKFLENEKLLIIKKSYKKFGADI